MTIAVALDSAPTAPKLDHKRIRLFWLPLAASWLLMGTEMPFVNAMLSRLNDSERMIAAFGIVGALSITIESPVIMLLTTSTALARTPQSYAMLRRYTQHLMLLTTMIHVLVGWTPLFDVIVRGWIGVPESLVEAVRLGMRIMVFWSAAIAWRRFKQGVMIRHGQTKFVGQGTVVRLVSSAGLAAALAIWSHLPGVAVGALALSAGVIVEAAYAHWAIRQTVRAQLGAGAAASDEPPLSYGDLVRFHVPLAGSTLLYLLAQPLASAALSRLPNSEAALAAWPVASGLVFIARAPVLALPEVIIALIHEPGSRPALRKFTVGVGAACVAVLALLGFTPLGHVYFRSLIGVSEELAGLAITGAQVAFGLPMIVAWQSWYRGNLTAQRATPAITLAMVINLATLVAALAVGVALRAPGVALAATALTVSTLAETLALGVTFNRRAARSAATPGAAAN
ncbi:MAG: hypothetical protein IT317_13080 [Anaerolineales bacterium]|nr:hypothetical protein [Anaerolineales bacterium]